MLGEPIDWVVRHAPCDVLLVDNHGYDGPSRVAVAADGGIFPPVPVRVAEAIAAANGGSIVLWGPRDTEGSEERRRTLQDYRVELADTLTVPVTAEAVRTDGGPVSPPDLLVRLGEDHRLRSALFDLGSGMPRPDVTTVTVHPHESRRPGVLRRALERVLF